MIPHQTAAENARAIAPAVFAKSFQIESPVFVCQQDILAILAPLGDVGTEKLLTYALGRGVEYYGAPAA